MMYLFKEDDINFVEEGVSFFSAIPLIPKFNFVGWTRDATNGEDELGYEAADGLHYIPVFIMNFCNYTISDEEDREQVAIDNGKNCAIYVHGKGDVSYVMRFTTKEIKSLDLSFFNEKDIYESFFHRS